MKHTFPYSVTYAVIFSTVGFTVPSDQENDGVYAYTFSLFCLRPYFYHKNTPLFSMAAFAQATFSAGLFLSYESLYYAINLINEAFTVSSFTETYNMVVSGLACPA